MCAKNTLDSCLKIIPEKKSIWENAEEKERVVQGIDGYPFFFTVGKLEAQS